MTYGERLNEIRNLSVIPVAELGARELVAEALRQEHHAYVPDAQSVPGRCSKCGCTDEAACPGGCSWVQLDLCSRCAFEALPPGTREARIGQARAVLISTSIESGCEFCAGIHSLADMLIVSLGGAFVCRECAEDPPAEADEPRIVVP
jgi:hypothetical protein